MRRPRIRLRSPGVKPGQRVGPLGPFRGRLGIHWVIAPLVLLVILGTTTWLFLRESRPGPPWRPVATVETTPLGSATQVAIGIFLGRLDDGRLFAVAEEPGCALRANTAGFVDCRDRRYGLDGRSGEGAALDLVPLRIHDGEVFVDPTRRISR